MVVVAVARTGTDDARATHNEIQARARRGGQQFLTHQRGDPAAVLRGSSGA